MTRCPLSSDVATRQIGGRILVFLVIIATASQFALINGGKGKGKCLDGGDEGKGCGKGHYRLGRREPKCPILPQCRPGDFVSTKQGGKNFLDVNSKSEMQGGQAVAKIVQAAKPVGAPARSFLLKKYDRRDDFEREARILPCFRYHMSIVQAVCAYWDKHELVLEYASFGDLTELSTSLTHRRPNDQMFFDPRLASAQLVASVAAVHRAGFIHGDVKPENVVRESCNHLRLIDFGLSRPVNRPLRRQGSIMTMAPELVLEDWMDRPVTEAIDWWAVGVVIYYLNARWLFSRQWQIDKDLDDELFYPYRPLIETIWFEDDESTEYEGWEVADLQFKPIPRQFSRDLVDLLNMLLDWETDERRFVGEKLKRQLLSHSYFAGIDWTEIDPNLWRSAG